MGDEKLPERRIYKKRRRAEQEAMTAQRITEAAMNLHGTVGPARTTIAAIAAEAGVQRGTVYRHFPDLASLYLACSAHWASLNPPPDPDAWRQTTEPEERLRDALSGLYAWYAWAEPMLANIYRDAPLVPAVADASQQFQQRFQALHAALMDGRSSRGRSRVRVAAAIAHALDFRTWQSLVGEQRLDAKDAVDLMLGLVERAGRRA